MAKITCAGPRGCGQIHTSAAEVRACQGQNAPAPAAPTRSTYKPKFQPKETFGQALRRNAQEKPTCWACESTDVDYKVLKGKTLRCCPAHPKTSHPDYERPLSAEEVATKLNATIEPVPIKRKVAAPNPRSTLQANGKRKFREGCEPLKYEGLEHSDDVTTRCGRCAGTGQYITGMLNGKPVGPGGPCFRCSGKGRQSCCDSTTHAARYEAIMNGDCEDISACCDVVRNDLYDRFGMRVYA